jgi:hypothetical protein
MNKTTTDTDKDIDLNLTQEEIKDEDDFGFVSIDPADAKMGVDPLNGYDVDSNVNMSPTMRLLTATCTKVGSYRDLRVKFGEKVDYDWPIFADVGALIQLHEDKDTCVEEINDVMWYYRESTQNSLCIFLMVDHGTIAITRYTDKEVFRTTCTWKSNMLRNLCVASVDKTHLMYKRMTSDLIMVILYDDAGNLYVPDVARTSDLISGGKHNSIHPAPLCGLSQDKVGIQDVFIDLCKIWRVEAAVSQFDYLTTMGMWMVYLGRLKSKPSGFVEKGANDADDFWRDIRPQISDKLIKMINKVHENFFKHSDGVSTLTLSEDNYRSTMFVKTIVTMNSLEVGIFKESDMLIGCWAQIISDMDFMKWPNSNELSDWMFNIVTSHNDKTEGSKVSYTPQIDDMAERLKNSTFTDEVKTKSNSANIFQAKQLGGYHQSFAPQSSNSTTNTVISVSQVFRNNPQSFDKEIWQQIGPLTQEGEIKGLFTRIQSDLDAQVLIYRAFDIEMDKNSEIYIGIGFPDESTFFVKHSQLSVTLVSQLEKWLARQTIVKFTWDDRMEKKHFPMLQSSVDLQLIKSIGSHRKKLGTLKRMNVESKNRYDLLEILTIGSRIHQAAL